MDISNKQTFSPGQVARAIGTSEASIKRWCDKGRLSFFKTAGGHRRLSLQAVLAFIRANDYSLAQPQVLGLPANIGTCKRTLAQATQLYGQALEQGDEETCLQIVLDMKLAGHSHAVIADTLIAPCFHLLGTHWEHGKAEVYQERRGVEITRRVCLGLKATLATPSKQAPLSIGASLAPDPYCLPGCLAELVCLESAWQAQFLGSNLPAQTITQAITDLKPQVFWLSVSTLDDHGTFLQDYQTIYDTCQAQQCAMVVGGQALTEAIRQKIHYSFYGDTMGHLQTFMENLGHPPLN